MGHVLGKEEVLQEVLRERQALRGKAEALQKQQLEVEQKQGQCTIWEQVLRDKQDDLNSQKRKLRQKEGELRKREKQLKMKEGDSSCSSSEEEDEAEDKVRVLTCLTLAPPRGPMADTRKPKEEAGTLSERLEATRAKLEDRERKVKELLEEVVRC